MARQLSEFATNKIIQWEGEVLYVYDDFAPGRPYQPGTPVRGTLTAGVGHTGNDIRAGMQVTKELSRKWFAHDIAKFCKVVDDNVKVPLNDNQFGALVSFAFNVGADNFLGSTLLKKLNKGDYDSVPSELLKWTRSKGKQLPGLVNRRNAEGGLWVTGSFVSSTQKADKPTVVGSVSAKLGAIGTGASSVGVAALGGINTAKEQLDGYSDLPYVKEVLLGLTVVGLVLTGLATYKRWSDSKK